MSPTGIHWRAVGIGAAVGIGGNLVLGTLQGVLPYDFERYGVLLFQLLTYGAGALVDIGCGATAGALARRSGALHGLLAGTAIALVSPVVGLLMFYVVSRGQAAISWPAWLAAVAIGTLLGLVLATLAGWVAARVAATRPR